MVLKLSVYVKNVIFFISEPPPPKKNNNVILIVWNCVLETFSILAYYVTVNGNLSSAIFMTSLRRGMFVLFPHIDLLK